MPISALILSASAMGLLGAYLAHRRGRNPYAWFCIGFFFGLLGAMFIFFAPAHKKTALQGESKSSIPSFILQGPTDKFWYYVDKAEQQIGPMSFEALRSAWGQGKISPATYVWHEDLPDWKPLETFLTSSP
ncbi:MAG: DUF4339 domain-containing protein [Chlamydiia bacterium]|nr:DUF4339 domain-containing protein [Chlamydiia bacterium]